MTEIVRKTDRCCIKNKLDYKEKERRLPDQADLVPERTQRRETARMKVKEGKKEQIGMARSRRGAKSLEI